MLFDNVGRETAARIVGLAHQKRLEAGECSFREGKDAVELFVLTSGYVKLSRLTRDGHEVTVLRLVGVAGRAFAAPGSPAAGYEP
jgi:CRP-like cAMP-binding protein